MFKTSLVMIGICALLGAKTTWASSLIEPETAALGADSTEIRHTFASHFEHAPNVAVVVALGVAGGGMMLMGRRAD